MAEITFIYGFNRADGLVNQLFAGFGGDIHRFEALTNNWTGLGQPISATARAYMVTYLDKVFWVNGVDDNKRYDGIGFTNEIATKKAPLAAYIISSGAFQRLFLGNLSFNGNTFASRVGFCDIPSNNDITWGLEYGMDLRQFANSPTVQAKSAYFKTRNIKVGDPFFITSGPNTGQYNVSSIDSEFQITLTTSLVAAATNSAYWVGGNWFDVVSNDNDTVKGFADNSNWWSNRMLVFKRNSVYRYDGQSIKPITGTPGTSSADSIVTKNQYVYYYNPDTGIWRTDSINAELISRPLQGYINGIAAANKSTIVGWKVGETQERLRWFVGDVVNNDENINVPNCFLEFDIATESWTPGSFPMVPRVTTQYVESNTVNRYIGDNSGIVYQDDIGNSDNGTDIPWRMDTGWLFPTSMVPNMGTSQYEIRIPKIQIHSRNGRGIQVFYMLYGTPFKIDKQWRPLGDIRDEVQEFLLADARDKDVIGRGVRLLLTESSSNKQPVIEKIDIFWTPVSQRSL